jgi:probable F420-dependent oxidoreductase
MARYRVGVQLQPQHTSIARLRQAWREADAIGVDSIWTWDHFYPLWGDRDGPHFEGYTLLAAIACDTERARFGMMVTCNSYRNPELLADVARTLDHLSGGRFVLGIGAGWFQRDYDEFGYRFGTARERLQQLEDAIPRIDARLAKLDPPPVQDRLPLLIGGGGEKVTLRLVAQRADLWNGFGPPANYARKNAILTDWCERVGRDPATVERTALIEASEVDDAEAYLEAGATHLIVMRGFGSFTDEPFDLEPVRRLVGTRDA